MPNRIHKPAQKPGGKNGKSGHRKIGTSFFRSPMSRCPDFSIFRCPDSPMSRCPDPPLPRPICYASKGRTHSEGSLLIGKLLAKVFGTSNEREVKRIRPQVEQINALEAAMQPLTDEQLRAKTEEFKIKVRERLEGIEDDAERATARQEVLNEILPEAFAVCREAGKRVLNMRHFDVQLIGGVVLHRGMIAEMKTGEGKTLVATLPVYLNALAGEGVHVVTVNDYLAKRDSEWMGKLYRFLGLSVGVIVHELDDDERREAYSADVTYGTNNEFGFDYLRDNMKFDLSECVQRGHNFGIVDEVDSILIDEARTPLIISGQSDESTDKYDKANRVVPHLVKGEEIEKPPGEPKEYTGDFVVDEKHKNTMITAQGWQKAQPLLPTA